MTYQEFCNEFKQAVLQNEEWNISEENYRVYPDGFTANGDDKNLEFIRNANARYHAMESDVLKGDFAVLSVEVSEDQIVDCRYAMKDLFEVWKISGWSRIWAILDEHIKLLKRFENKNIMPAIESYEEAKERLIIRPINYAANKYQLKEQVYKVYGDIALVLYVLLYDDENGFGTSKIDKKQLEKWDKEWNEVFDEALANTNTKMLPRLYVDPWNDLKDPDKKGKFMSKEGDVKKIGSMQIPLVTTDRRTNGAIAMFYPGVKERIAELFDGSYYVVFTSIHEARIHRVGSISPRRILALLKDINNTFPKEEILSKKVFLYDAGEKTFEALEL